MGVYFVVGKGEKVEMEKLIDEDVIEQRAS